MSYSSFPDRVRFRPHNRCSASSFLRTAVAAVVVCAFVVATPTASFAQKLKKAKCDGATGWAAVSGQPVQLARGSALGLYLWNKGGTWRVSATGPERKLHVFQGTLDFDAPVTAKPVGLEGRSDVVVSDADSVSFTFKNFGQLDGIGVESPCASVVTLNATIDGIAIAPTQIFVGPNGSPAAEVPLVLRKDAVLAPPVAPSSAPATLVTACPTSSWPENTVGKPPTLKKFRLRGVYVWFDNGVWQFAATKDANRPAATIAGRMTFNAPVTAIKRTDMEANDGLRTEPRFDGTSVVFSFKVGAASDGFSATSPCASQVSVEVTVDGEALPTSSLLIGPGSSPATAMPFVISR